MKLKSSFVFLFIVTCGLVSFGQSNKIKPHPLDRAQQSIEIIDLIISSNKKFINSDVNVSNHLKNQNKKLFFFFAGYCHYCKQEMPEFLASQKEFQKCNIDLIPYNVDKTQAQAETVIKDWKIDLATLWDSDSKLRRFLNIRRIPHLIYTNKEGLILKEASGTNQYRNLLTQLRNTCLKGGT